MKTAPSYGPAWKLVPPSYKPPRTTNRYRFDQPFITFTRTGLPRSHYAWEASGITRGWCKHLSLCVYTTGRVFTRHVWPRGISVAEASSGRRNEGRM